MIDDLLDIQSASIMIIDDEPIHLDLLVKALRDQGFNNLKVFRDPFHAIVYYRLSRPDLVLLDYMMPDLNGLEVLTAFRETFYQPAPPVVVLTADQNRETRIHFLQMGARDFLLKPLDLQELHYRVKNLLQSYFAHKEIIEHNGNLDALVEKRTAELKTTQQEILERLGIAAEFRDTDTHFHTQRVGHYAGCLAKTMGFNNIVIEELQSSAPLHDVGKIGVPDHVLFKAGKLDDHEWELMKQHTVHGYNILKGSDSRLLKNAEIIALTHHERWDGSGYPHGLKQREIHFYGRVTAVVDVYDALTMERPYKKAWSHDAAMRYICDGAGTQFDPELTEALKAAENEILAIARYYA